MTTPTSVTQLLTEFKNKTTSGVYKHFTNRNVIAVQIQDRIANPHLINQGASSLCGPAALLYNVAKKSPLTYAKFITDLYDHGKAKLGSLEVEPGSDNRAYNLPAASGMSQVDWIGLAGIRDSENDFFDYESYNDEAAGITMPGDLLSWFKQAGFTDGENDTNLIDDEDLSTLIKAHKLHQSGHVVCLFVGANVFMGKKDGRATADHWVVLNSPVLIDNHSVQPLIAKGTSVDDDQSILSKKLSFRVFTWGNSAYPVNKNFPDLTVEYFLDYFYGYISCK